MLVSIRRLAGNQNGTVEQTLMGVFEVLCGDLLAVSSQINIAELLVAARPQEESIVSRFEADVLSVIADTLTQAGTAARWEGHGIGAHPVSGQNERGNGPLSSDNRPCHSNRHRRRRPRR